MYKVMPVKCYWGPRRKWEWSKKFRRDSPFSAAGLPNHRMGWPPAPSSACLVLSLAPSSACLALSLARPLTDPVTLGSSSSALCRSCPSYFVELLREWIELRAGLVQSDAQAYFKLVSSPPARSTRRFFSSIYCGNLLELLEINLTKWQWPLWLGPPGVFNSQNCPPWASSNSLSIAFFSYPALVPTAVSTRVSCPVNCYILYSSVNLSFWGTVIFPVSLPLVCIWGELTFQSVQPCTC